MLNTTPAQLARVQGIWGLGAQLFENDSVGIPYRDESPMYTRDSYHGETVTLDPNTTPFMYVPIVPGTYQQDIERSNNGEKQGNILGAAFFAIAAGAGGAAVGAAGGAEAGAGTAAAAGTDASTGLYAGESAAAGSSTYGTVGGVATTEAGGAIVTTEQLSTAGKVLGTVKSLLGLHAAQHIPDGDGYMSGGQADVGVAGAPWDLTQGEDGAAPVRRRAQSSNIPWPFLILGAVLIFLLLKGR